DACPDQEHRSEGELRGRLHCLHRELIACSRDSHRRPRAWQPLIISPPVGAGFNPAPTLRGPRRARLAPAEAEEVPCSRPLPLVPIACPCTTRTSSRSACLARTPHPAAPVRWS